MPLISRSMLVTNIQSFNDLSNVIQMDTVVVYLEFDENISTKHPTIWNSHGYTIFYHKIYLKYVIERNVWENTHFFNKKTWFSNIYIFFYPFLTLFGHKKWLFWSSNGIHFLSIIGHFKAQVSSAISCFWWKLGPTGFEKSDIFRWKKR